MYRKISVIALLLSLGLSFLASDLGSQHALQTPGPLGTRLCGTETHGSQSRAICGLFLVYAFIFGRG